MTSPTDCPGIPSTHPNGAPRDRRCGRLVFHCTVTHPYVFPLALAFLVHHNKPKSRRNPVYARRLDSSVLAFSLFHCTVTHIYVFPLALALCVAHNKPKSRRNSVYARRLDPSGLSFSLFHCTDTRIYVFPLALALCVVHNNNKSRKNHGLFADDATLCTLLTQSSTNSHRRGPGRGGDARAVNMTVFFASICKIFSVLPICACSY
jgi:hypothetical protein